MCGCCQSSQRQWNAPRLFHSLRRHCSQCRIIEFYGFTKWDNPAEESYRRCDTVLHIAKQNLPMPSKCMLAAVIVVCITLFLKEMQLSLQVFPGTSQSDLNFSQTGATAATHEGHTHMLSHTATGTLRPPSSESFLQICLVLGLLFRSPISTAAGRVRSSGWGSLCAALVVISAPAATRALQSVNPNMSHAALNAQRLLA